MSVDFTASGDGIDWGSVPAAEDLTQKTVMAWVKAQSYGHDTTFGVVVSSAGGTGGVDAFGWEFEIANAGGAFANTLYYVERYPSLQNADWTANPGDFATGSWKHIAVTIDNSDNDNDPIFYVDGILSATTEDTAPIGSVLSNSGGNLVSGNRNITGGSFDLTFDGDVEDVRIYDSILPANIIADIAAEKNFRLAAPFPVWRAKMIGATGLQTFGGTALAGGNTIIDDIGGAAGVPISSPTANDSVNLAFQG